MKKLIPFLSLFYVGIVYSANGDESDCVRRYQNTGAVPGESSCPLTASTASVGLGSYNCTANSGLPYIERYCGQVSAQSGDQKCTSTGNPIEFSYGNKFKSEIDFLPGGSNLNFERYFNSRVGYGHGLLGKQWRHSFSSELKIGIDGTALSGVMTYSEPDGRTVALKGSAASGFKSFRYSENVIEISPSYMGKVKQFALRAPNKLRLEVFDGANSGAPSGYAEFAKLTERWAASGRFIKVNYGSNAEISSVVDGLSGRSLTMEYYRDGANKPVALMSVRVPSGLLYNYRFKNEPPAGPEDYLLAVERPYKQGENSIRRYLYDELAYAPVSSNDPLNRFVALTGIADDGFDRYSVYKYSSNPDYFGKAVSSELGGGLVSETVTHTLANSADATSSTSKPSLLTSTGAESQVVTRWLSGRMVVVSQSQPAGAGCGASFSERNTKIFNSDFGSEIATSWGPKDSLTCFDRAVVNGRSVESAKITGLPGTPTSAGDLARCSEQLQATSSLLEIATKTSTQWHNDWDLPIKIAAPGVITTHVYNGAIDPDTNSVLTCAPSAAKLPDGKPIAVLCKTIEEETTDLTGVKGFAAVKASPANRRVTTFTYNQWGQMETKDGPLPGTVDKEFWSYYTTATSGKNALGDLFTYKDAVGNITTYLKYNETGSPLEVTDANGVLTKYTYDLRDRPSSVEVDGQKTEYVFDKAGRLQKVIRPDAVATTLEYDAAYRLKAAFDSNGNRIDFVLDGAGNRKSEVMSDKNGAIRKQLTRTFDVLGRMSGLQGVAQ